MKVGDNYRMPLWGSVWKLLRIDRLQTDLSYKLDFQVVRGRNKAQFISRITSGDFEGELTK